MKKSVKSIVFCSFAVKNNFIPRLFQKLVYVLLTALLLASPLLAQEKIKIRRQGKQAEDVQEETKKKDGKVSLRRSERGDVEPDEPTPPIEYKRHSIFAGGRTAMTVTSATTPNADGSALSPDFGARGEYVYNGMWLGILDLGYTQSRLKLLEDPEYNPRQNGVARADYIKTALLGGARYGLGNLKFPRFLAGKEWLKPFFVYATAGMYFNFLLSTEIEVTSNLSSRGLYDYSPYANGFIYGLQTGVGIEMQIWKLMTFIDFNYSRALSDNFNRTESRMFVTGPTAEHNFIINVGAKYLVYSL